MARPDELLEDLPAVLVVFEEPDGHSRPIRGQPHHPASGLHPAPRVPEVDLQGDLGAHGEVQIRLDVDPSLPDVRVDVIRSDV